VTNSSFKSLGTNLDLSQAVKCPEKMEKNEWIASHVVDFVNGINILYASISEHCTKDSCPVMNSPKCEYAWMDKENKKYQKPVSVSASDYVTLLMDWVETQINNEELFPSDPETPFPKKFEKK